MPRIRVISVSTILAFALLPLGTGNRGLSFVLQESLSQSVVLTVTVTDKQRNYVRGLSGNAFEVFDNNKPQHITEFDEHDSPAVVGIVFDLSGSINPNTISSGREAVSNLVRSSHPDTDFFLVGVSSQPQMRQDWTRDAVALSNAVPMISPKVKLSGYTAFYDACYFSISKLIGATKRKRVLLIVSDGEDNNSKHTFLELERLVETSGVLVYVVGALRDEDQDLGSSLGMEGRGILDELSSVSGGVSYYPKKAAQIGAAFIDIGTELRNQFSLGFQPDRGSLANAKRHSLKVKLASDSDSKRELRDLKVRSRHGYYPGASK